MMYGIVLFMFQGINYISRVKLVADTTTRENVISNFIPDLRIKVFAKREGTV